MKTHKVFNMSEASHTTRWVEKYAGKHKITLEETQKRLREYSDFLNNQYYAVVRANHGALGFGNTREAAIEDLGETRELIKQYHKSEAGDLFVLPCTIAFVKQGISQPGGQKDYGVFKKYHQNTPFTALSTEHAIKFTCASDNFVRIVCTKQEYKDDDELFHHRGVPENPDNKRELNYEQRIQHDDIDKQRA